MAFDVEYTVRLAERLRPYRLRWIEDYLLPEDLDALARAPAPALADARRGEHWQLPQASPSPPATALAGFLQPDIQWCGGLTACQRIVARRRRAPACRPSCTGLEHAVRRAPHLRHRRRCPGSRSPGFGTAPGVPLSRLRPSARPPRCRSGAAGAPPTPPASGLEISEAWLELFFPSQGHEGQKPGPVTGRGRRAGSSGTGKGSMEQGCAGRTCRAVLGARPWPGRCATRSSAGGASHRDGRGGEEPGQPAGPERRRPGGPGDGGGRSGAPSGRPWTAPGRCLCPPTPWAYTTRVRWDGPAHREEAPGHYVSRLTFATQPGGRTRPRRAQALRDLVAAAGGRGRRVLRSHFASLGAPDLVLEQEAPDLAGAWRRRSASSPATPGSRPSRGRSPGGSRRHSKREVYQVID